MWLLCFLVCTLSENRRMAIHLFFPFAFHVYFLWLRSGLFLYLYISEVSVWHANVCASVLIWSFLKFWIRISEFHGSMICHHLLILENYWPLSHQTVLEQTFLLSFHLGHQLHMFSVRYCPMTVCYFCHIFFCFCFILDNLY